jgi:hypothetical protein
MQRRAFINHPLVLESALLRAQGSQDVRKYVSLLQGFALWKMRSEGLDNALAWLRCTINEAKALAGVDDPRVRQAMDSDPEAPKGSRAWCHMLRRRNLKHRNDNSTAGSWVTEDYAASIVLLLVRADGMCMLSIVEQLVRCTAARDSAEAVEAIKMRHRAGIRLQKLLSVKNPILS